VNFAFLATLRLIVLKAFLPQSTQSAAKVRKDILQIKTLPFPGVTFFGGAFQRARLPAISVGDDPRNHTKGHEQLFVLVRVI
jgi:hypothetical protein